MLLSRIMNLSKWSVCIYPAKKNYPNKNYGFYFVKNQASALKEEENREGKPYERGKNQGKENITNDVGTMGGRGEVTQDNPTRGRKFLSNRAFDPKP